MKKLNLMLMLILAALSIMATVYGATTTSSTTGAYDTSSAIFISQVNQDPDPVMAGNLVDVRINVANQGGVSANNVSVQIIPQYPYTVVSDSVLSISTLNAYQSGSDAAILKFSLRIDPSASQGSYPIKLSYKVGNGNLITTQNSVSVNVNNQKNAEVIYIDKTVLIPGQESNISFTINNVGGAPLNDLTFSWVNADDLILPVGSDNTRYINSIDVGKSVVVTYDVIADSNAAAGLYKLALSLSYADSVTGTKQSTSTIAGVYVGGGTDFDVAVSDSSSGTTSFSIANIGSNPANSVTVLIPNQPGWTVSGSNSMIIGNLNKGDYTVASFKLSSSASGNRTGFSRSGNGNANGSRGQAGAGQASSGAGAAGSGQTGASQNFRGGFNQTQSAQFSNSVLVRIVYTNTMGQRQTVDKQVSMSTSLSAFGSSSSGATGTNSATSFGGRRTQNTDPFSQYIWYLIGLVVLVGAFVAYRIHKRKKFLEETKKASTVHVDLKHNKKAQERFM